MNEAIIAIGSNINPEQNVDAALTMIAAAFTLVKKSQFIYTAPVGYKDQADFLNGSVLIESPKDRAAITASLKQIENKLGRRRDGLKNGPRRIDLDLILFNKKVVDEDVYDRDFLLQAIQELLPNLQITH